MTNFMLHIFQHNKKYINGGNIYYDGSLCVCKNMTGALGQEPRLTELWVLGAQHGGRTLRRSWGLGPEKLRDEAVYVITQEGPFIILKLRYAVDWPCFAL